MARPERPIMPPDVPIERLVEAGVVHEVGEDRLALTPDFVEAIESYRESLADVDGASLRRTVHERTTDEDVLALLERMGEYDREAYYEALAAADFLEDDFGDVLGLLPAVGNFRYEPTRTDGVPEHFLPMPGDQLVRYLPLFSRAVVYVWREDCDPCDLVRADLERVFEEPPADLALVAVYGPEHSALLQEAHDVVGAPTTLFVRDGRVDARLVGAHPTDVVENEVEIIRE